MVKWGVTSRWSFIQMVKYEDDNHREDAPHLRFQTFSEKVSNFRISKNLSRVIQVRKLDIQILSRLRNV